jgi:putative aminopeptidase FrvX
MIKDFDIEPKRVLEDLCNITGVSGYESSIVNYLFEILKSEEFDNLYIDNVGNLIVYKKGYEGKKKILISAHIDEVGFQIIKKRNDMEYHIKALGNIKPWNAMYQKVKSNSATAVLYPCNNENIQDNNYEKLLLIGDETISIGDTFSFDSDLVETEKLYRGKALDNRISCFCLYKLITERIQTKADIYFVFSVQEEITMRGIRVAKTSIQPNLSINVDVSPECEKNSLVMGEGVGIKISDSIGISDISLVDFAKKICIKENIKYQMEVSSCGTTELIITNEIDCGSKEIGISIPCKYMHTANTITNKEDVKNCIQLLKNMIVLY